jgi:hypothetical protein
LRPARISWSNAYRDDRYAALCLAAGNPLNLPDRPISWSRLAGTRSCVGVQSLMSTLAGVKILGHISPCKYYCEKTSIYDNSGCDIPTIRFCRMSHFQGIAYPNIWYAQAAHTFCTACSHAVAEPSLPPATRRASRRAVRRAAPGPAATALPPRKLSHAPINSHLKLSAPPANRFQRHSEAD